MAYKMTLKRRAALKRMQRGNRKTKRTVRRRRIKASNPFRRGKVKRTTRRIGKVFKRKGRFYIVARLRNGVKVARPWSKSRRR
jgi:hypothetical protein